MRRIIRYFFISVAAALLFLVALVAIFVAVFDANEYKDELSALVQERSGRDLQFHGDVSLTIYPALGMKLGAMSFSNAEGFGPKPMIKVSEASVSVDLASLVAMRPEVDRLLLRDLEIDLQKNAAGVTNWDDLIAEDAAGDSASSGAGDSEPSSAPGSGIEAAFGGLDLQNIRLSWRDAQAGSELLIRDLDLSTGRIVPDQPFPLTLHADASASGDLDVMIDLSTTVEYLRDRQQLTLDDLILSLNEFQIGGFVRVRDFTRPALEFDLSSADLDVDALLGEYAGAGETATVEQPGETAEIEDFRIELPVDTLRTLDIDGKLRIDNLKVQNLTLSDVDMALNAKQGLLSLKPLTLKAYGGAVDSAVAIDVRGDVPKYGLSETVKGLQIGGLLNDYSGQAIISGSLDADSNLSTRGEWLSQLKSNSNGTLSFAFTDGALNGFNIRHSIEVARARLRGEKPPSEKRLKTDFSSLSVSGVVRNGVFSSDDLDLQAPLLRVGGRGSVDFNRETIDYLVDAKLVGTIEGQAGEQADELAGLPIPVAIEGPFISPDIDVQLDEMLKARVDADKARIKAEIEKQKQELQQQLEAEKKALAEAKKREQEKQRELEKARLEKKKAEAEQKARDKLKKLLD